MVKFDYKNANLQNFHELGNSKILVNLLFVEILSLILGSVTLKITVSK